MKSKPPVFASFKTSVGFVSGVKTKSGAGADDMYANIFVSSSIFVVAQAKKSVIAMIIARTISERRIIMRIYILSKLSIGFLFISINNMVFDYLEQPLFLLCKFCVIILILTHMDMMEDG